MRHNSPHTERLIFEILRSQVDHPPSKGPLGTMRIAIDPFKKHRPQRPSPGVELTFRLKLSTTLVTEEMHVSPRTTGRKTSEPVLDHNSFVARWRCATCFCLIGRSEKTSQYRHLCEPSIGGGCNPHLTIVNFSEIIAGGDRLRNRSPLPVIVPLPLRLYHHANQEMLSGAIARLWSTRRTLLSRPAAASPLDFLRDLRRIFGCRFIGETRL
jgi:hypothetical protein